VLGRWTGSIHGRGGQIVKVYSNSGAGTRNAGTGRRENRGGGGNRGGLEEKKVRWKNSFPRKLKAEKRSGGKGTDKEAGGVVMLELLENELERFG